MEKKVDMEYRGLTVLACPEHLAEATDREIGAWRSVTQEEEIAHKTRVCGGSGFIELTDRRRHKQQHKISLSQWNREAKNQMDTDRTFETPGETLPVSTLQ